MKIGPASLASLARLEKADTAYREARARGEEKLRILLDKELEGLEWERARAAREAHVTIIEESGRSNIAAISRAIHSKDHATAKAILAKTEELVETIKSGIHPDDKVIFKADDRYRFVEMGRAYEFKVVRGEYVGVSPIEADELDDMNALERIADWEERRAND